jgi:hypothetical protein
MKSVCGGCGLIFTCTTAFDKHRTGDYSKLIYAANGKVIGRTPSERKCLTVPGLVALGMVQNEQGWWHDPIDDEAKEKLRAFREKKNAEQIKQKGTEKKSKKRMSHYEAKRG